MSFTERARAEAERAATIAHSSIRRDDGSAYDSDEHIAYRRGFFAGAEFAVSQPVTDDEVLAALNADYAIRHPKAQSADSLEPYGEETVRIMRAALEAAREAGR